MNKNPLKILHQILCGFTYLNRQDWPG